MLPHGYLRSLGDFVETHTFSILESVEFYQSDKRILISKINDAHTPEVLSSY
jgi:hypothetical protein